ncbi:MAG: DegQ family serine endoprotease [Candidatus Calescibacterium sp.]|nr:DegQ family serine endoprotease [Candidatus Calescibacterium sp.]MDW8087327.1 DegQ family serine endoprotease [Candidatus Calescibacterium sp.]
MTSNLKNLLGIALIIGIAYLLYNSIKRGDFERLSSAGEVIQRGVEEGKEILGFKEENTELSRREVIKQEMQAVPQQGGGQIYGLPQIADIVEEVRKGVVNISTTRVEKQQNPFYWFFGPGPFGQREREEFFRRFFGEPEIERFSRSLGSGFIMSSDGYIVTNSHVVRGAKDIKVTLWDGRSYDAKLVGVDDATDIAILKIEEKNLPFLKFGDSETLRVGDWVIAIGNPFGLGHTVTVGVVSAKGRSLGIARYEDFIQTDAAINPGNSGGPLLNLKGEIVGINTAILNPSGIAAYAGIGFAIPSSLASKVVSALIKEGKVKRAWLGVYIQEVSPDIAKAMGLPEPSGALVTEVLSGSPAEKAGIKRGDIIMEFDGKKVKSFKELPLMVSLSPVGKRVNLKVIRDGKELSFELVLVEMPEESKIAQQPGEQQEQPQEEGIYIKNFGMRVKDTPSGPQVISVDPGSAANMAGITQGDIIVEINRKEVKNSADVERLLKDQKSALFLLNRGGRYVYVAIRIG